MSDALSAQLLISTDLTNCMVKAMAVLVDGELHVNLVQVVHRRRFGRHEISVRH